MTDPEPDNVRVEVGDSVTDADGVPLEVNVRDSVAGRSTMASPLTPFPNCPYLSSPQQEMSPPAVRAHVCRAPAVMALAPVNAVKPVGAN